MSDVEAGPAYEGSRRVASRDQTPANHLPGSDFRFQSLDALRGLAAVSVIFFHTTWPSYLAQNPLARHFYLSVDLFFLLSGFVIAASYSQRVGTPGLLATFAKRRFFRIFPLQWAVLAVLVAQECLKLYAQRHGGGAPTTQAAFTGTNGLWPLLQHVLLVQGWGFSPVPSWNPPSWSVSAELLLYVLFALAGYAGWLRSSGIVGGLAVAGLVGYLLLALRFDGLDVTADYGILRCLAGFPIGAALFLLGRKRLLPALRAADVRLATALEAGGCCALLAVLAFAEGSLVVLAIPAFAVLIALFAAERGACSRALKLGVFQFLGAISYSIYLVHVPIRNQLVIAARLIGVPSHRAEQARVVLDINPLYGDAFLLVFAAVSIAVAALTFRFIEEPARLFGRKTAPTRGGIVPGEGVKPIASR